MKKTPGRKVVDLHPSAWQPDWHPPIGNDPIPGEKPHIWQEFKRDLEMHRPSGEPFWGRAWALLPAILLLIAVLSWIDINGGPEWLLAIRSLF